MGLWRRPDKHCRRPVTYLSSWDFGDSQSGSGRTVSHTFTEPGAYSATVTAQDGSGHSASAHTTILVSGVGRETYETGCVTIEADTMEALDGTEHYLFTGNVVLNGFVKCIGTVEVQGTEISSTGDLYIEVAGSSPADNETYYIARGGFTIDANADEQGECYGQITQTADIAFDFFGFPVEFSGVKLFEDHVTVGGELVIPWIDVGGVEITFTISPDGIDFSGKITLPNFELSGFGLSGAYMELDTEKLVWKGGATMKIPGMGFELGIELGFLAGVLNMVKVEVGDLNKPVLFSPPPPTPIVYLQKISGGLENIAPDAPDPVILTAGAGFTGGPKINLPSLDLLSGALKVAGGEYAILGGDIDLEIDTGGRFTAEGTGYLINDSFGTFGAFVLILDINKGVYFEGKLYYPPGESFAILVVTGKGKIDFDFNFQASLDGSLKAPNIWPIIGGMTFGSAKAYIDNDLISTGVKIGKKICALGHCVDLSIKASVTFVFADGDFSVAQNWDNIGEVHFDNQMRANIMGSAAISSAGTQFEVPSGTSVVMFRMEAQGDPSFTLEAPDKTVYTPNDEQALWRENIAIGELWCAIPQPQAGVWKASAGSSVKSYKMEMRTENQPPTLAITSPAKDAEVEAGQPVSITWDAADDPEDDARISLYYDEDREGENGNTITAGISSGSAKTSYAWDTTGVAPGRYYMYGKIDDGKNVPVFAYSRGAVTIKRSDFPAPSITSAALGPEGLSLAWNAINGADGYRIYYRAVADDTTLEEGSAQAVWGETSSVLNNLDWGRSYKIAVTAFTRDGKESGFSEPIDIKMINTQGNNNPEIQSAPIKIVPAGETYTYQVDARDQDGDALTYRVTKAPSGMSVNSTGKVSWATDTGDVGLHEVEIMVADAQGGSATQAFNLQVVSEDEGNPGPYAAIRCSAVSGPAPLTVNFNAIAAGFNGDTLQYAWEFGDDKTSIEQNPSHTFQNKGSYSVTLTVTTDSGLSTSKTVMIQVTDKIPLVSPPKVRAQVLGSTVTLSWDEVDGAAGFRFHYGTTQNDINYTQPIDVGKVNKIVFTQVPKGKYTLVFRSYLSSAAETWDSEPVFFEVKSTLPFPSAASTGVLEGVVTDAKSGNPVPGATINFIFYSATTDPAGKFKLERLPIIKQALLSAAASGYSDGTPVSVSTESGKTVTCNVQLTPLGDYDLCGQVTGAVTQGVTMTLSGKSSGTLQTDASGNYCFQNLEAGSYTITPSLKGHVFEPLSRSVEITDTDVSGADFISSKGQCPAQAAAPDKVDLLRRFRDGVLAQSEHGKEYIQLYYRHAQGVTAILQKYPQLREDAAKFIQDIVPWMSAQMHGKKYPLPLHVKKRLDIFIKNLCLKAGPELAGDLKRVKDNFKQRYK
ncbi:MAG: PKD domain-containing protein [Proteobacteria bacterium]|nr:PKD domain-containing protein [Pseudomonadota bacterium]